MIVGLGAELGDAIFAMPTIKALGIREVVNLDRPWTRPDWKGRSKSLKRLAESQDYISSFRDHAGERLNADLTNYRNIGQAFGQTIVSRIALWGRVKVDASQPWLTVEPSKKTGGRIIVSRCPRWTAPSWPWKALVRAFQREMMFIGTTEEYKAFCGEFGFIERLLCSDHLEIAEAIAGSELFIGNQSSPNAICEGLKHPSILEVSNIAPDCWFDRENTVYSVDGNFTAMILGQIFHGEIVIPMRGFKTLVGKSISGTEEGPKEKIIYGRTIFECEATARASYVLAGLPVPSMKEIREEITPI